MGKKFRTHVQGESLQKKIDADFETYYCLLAMFLAFFLLTLYIWLFYLGVWDITLGLAITFSVFTLLFFIYAVRKFFNGDCCTVIDQINGSVLLTRTFPEKKPVMRCRIHCSRIGDGGGRLLRASGEQPKHDQSTFEQFVHCCFPF